MKIKFILLATLIVLTISVATAQETLSSDELFKQAREATFDQKDYTAAIDLCKKALRKSPNYTDVKIFLGRLYTWSEQPDSARMVFNDVLRTNPGDEDASLAYGSLEFWNNNSEKALLITENGLSKNFASKELLLLKAKILNDLKRFNEANKVVKIVLEKDPKNTEARALFGRINDNSSTNSIGITYDFVYFDKQFNDPWQLLSVDYGRQTKLGMVTARFNYANRFKEGGLQMELEAYPRLSKTFYAYVGAAYSADEGVFPRYRAGFSLYANLPASFEAEAGLRFLRFSSNTMVYTLSAGKYYKNYWFNLRTYLTPSRQNISQSYSFTTRYYYGAADDYVSIGIGTGISPDNNGNNILLNNNYKLKSNNITIGFRRGIKNRNVITVRASYLNQEYRRSAWGNQLNFSAGYQRRF